MSIPVPASSRVIAYIDGFNLYFGLKTKGWKSLYWLDVHALSENLLKPGQTLVAVKYFTSRVSATLSDPDQPRRQNTYIEALATRPVTRLYFGHYLSKPIQCKRCGNQWGKNDEKMTDVNIATELLVDAFQNGFDAALIVSADSDLVGPVTKIRTLFPGKRVVAVFPPKRTSKRLAQEANSHFTLGRGILAQSQLSDPVVKPDGFALHRPSTWT